MVDAGWAFARYEAVRDALPDAEFPAQVTRIANLSAVVGDHDTFLLDAFGVLNIGDRAIPGAVDFVAALRRAGKRVAVVSNSASVPTAATRAKFAALGFDFAPEEVVTSRDALKAALAQEPPRLWGVMAAAHSQIDELGIAAHALTDDPGGYAQAEAFILLGSAGWTEARQALLIDSLRRTPRPVLVGNPDLVAPREDGLSLEPGHFAHDLAQKTGCRPVFHGKPFPGLFALAESRFGPFDPARTVMVGDTLHTDVLGGAAFGLRTCLLHGYGLLAGEDVEGLTAASGILPDIVAERL